MPTPVFITQRLDDRDTIELMLKLGGSFTRALAATALVADPENYQRLRAAFPELFEKYANFPTPPRSQP